MSLLYPKDYSYKVELLEPSPTFGEPKYTIVFTCNGGKFGTDETIAEYELTALELLERLQAEPARWIPVSESTPQKGQQVCVIGYRVAELYPAPKEPSVGLVYWNTAQSSRCSDTCFYSFGYTNITHWMPTPELPKPTQP